MQLTPELKVAGKRILSASNSKQPEPQKLAPNPRAQNVALCMRKVVLKEVMNLLRQKKDKSRDSPCEFCLFDFS